MEQLTFEELLSCFGGSEKTYKEGYTAGKELRKDIDDVLDCIKGFWDGFWNC